MPRENSFSDSDGRSLTPDLEDELNDEKPPPDSRASQVPAPAPEAFTVARMPQVSLTDDVPGLKRGSTIPSAANGSTAVPDILPSHIVTEPRSPETTPSHRFRGVVRKVIAMQRGSTAVSRFRVGAEPGVDPRRDSANQTHGHIRQDCLIEVVDYSVVRSTFTRMTNAGFVQLLGDPRSSNKETWAKVRWINIGGISWDVISALSLKYGAYRML